MSLHLLKFRRYHRVRANGSVVAPSGVTHVREVTMRSVHWSVALLLLVAYGCGGGTGTPPAASAGADSVNLALSQFETEAFDTIQWPSDSAAVARGAVVWVYSCRRCHGDEGYGDAGFVQGGETLEPPSLRAPDWRFDDDLDGLRRQVYTGTEEGMPHWGLVGLKPRDIDAVSRYIQQVIRS